MEKIAPEAFIYSSPEEEAEVDSHSSTWGLIIGFVLTALALAVAGSGLFFEL